MLDDILAGIFGEMLSARVKGTKRAQLLVRFFFGLLGAGLGVAGAIHFAGLPRVGIEMRLATVAMFAFLASFCLLNIAFARKWQWPGILFIISFVGMFVTRLVFGP